MGKVRRSALALAIALLAGCAQEPSSGAVKTFFAKGQIGSSPDVAIVKFGDMGDHVITVHGFADDFASCTQVSKALNQAACEDTNGIECLNPYSCQVLNK